MWEGNLILKIQLRSFQMSDRELRESEAAVQGRPREPRPLAALLLLVHAEVGVLEGEEGEDSDVKVNS